MARPKSASHDLKREEILDWAALCFAKHSYYAASMNDIAHAGGTSKARLYHYYPSKEAILFDLLDRYTLRLLDIVAETEAYAVAQQLQPRAALHELIVRFLVEYETSATRHAALLHDASFLGPEQHRLIVSRQRQLVGAFTRFLQNAYPERMARSNPSALTMMVFGMINWTFTWLRPDGPLRYTDFATEVMRTLEGGFNAPP